MALALALVGGESSTESYGNMKESSQNHKERIVRLDEKYRHFAKTFLEKVTVFFPTLRNKTLYLSRVEQNQAYYICGSMYLIFPLDIEMEEVQGEMDNWEIIIGHDVARKVSDILLTQQREGRVAMSVHLPKKIVFQRISTKIEE